MPTEEFKVKWRCPKCGADANEHGKGGAEKCQDRFAGDKYCQGFLCECDQDTEANHGLVFSDRCPSAHCYHCGWSGTFPQPLNAITPWEKKALEAGWTPPAGWAETHKKEVPNA